MKKQKEVFIDKNIIDKYLKENNLSKTKFCKLCKISPSTLNAMLCGDNFRLNALLKIINVLKIEFHEIFIKTK